MYEQLKDNGHMPLVDGSAVVDCPQFGAKPIRSDSAYSASESQNSEDNLLDDLHYA